MIIKGIVCSRDGKEVIEAELESEITNVQKSIELGNLLAHDFISKGASRILKK